MKFDFDDTSLQNKIEMSKKIEKKVVKEKDNLKGLSLPKLESKDTMIESEDTEREEEKMIVK